MEVLRKLKLIGGICMGVFSITFVHGQIMEDSLQETYFAGFIDRNNAELTIPWQNDSILKSAFFYDVGKQTSPFSPQVGNLGSAIYTGLATRTSWQYFKLYDDGFDQFAPYVLSPVRQKNGKAERRFTNVNYHIGSKKEQHIFIKHEQKIKPWMFAGLDFGAMSSPGDFSRQLNANRNFDLYFGFEAPSKVYRTYLSYTSNRVLNEENGGISNDSIFKNATSLDTRTLPVNLRDANTRHKSKDYLIKQELNLTRLFSKSDSIDFVDSSKKSSFVLSHLLWWNRKSVLFTTQNVDTSYFNNIYIDSLTTYDSSFYNDLFQIAMIEYASGITDHGGRFILGAGYKYQDTRYKTGIADTLFYTGSGFLRFGYSTAKFVASLEYAKVISGNETEGYNSRLQLFYSDAPDKYRLFIGAGAGKYVHSAKNILYSSNHFKWLNNFNLLEAYDLIGGINVKKLRLDISASSQMLKNQIFYREDFLPQSYGEFVSVSDLTISNKLPFGKFGLDNVLVLNNTSNDNVIPVPRFSSYSSIYYSNRLFHDALGLKAGIDVSYFSKYYGYGYMPATGVFYLQKETQIGNSPLFGVFVNLNIKTANLFIKVDHANAGIGERNYFGAYHYPIPGRTIKFGVSWDLKD